MTHSQAMTATSTYQTTSTPAFARLAGASGIIAGLCSIAYAVAFLILKNLGLADGLLALGAFATIPVVIMLHAHLRETDNTFALLGLILGIVGGLGGAIHGMYDLANAIVPPAHPLDAALPNPLDPRGFLAFGVTGLGGAVFASLILRSTRMARGFGALGLTLAVLLFALFVGNLLVNDAKSLAILLPGGLASLLANPAWLIGLGSSFLRQGQKAG